MAEVSYNVEGSATPFGKVEYAFIVCVPNVATVKAGKATVAEAPAANVPVQLKVVAVPLSILYEIVAEVSVFAPRFRNCTLGMILPWQLSPFGLNTSVIEASLGLGGIHASELINDLLSGLPSRTARIRCFWSLVKIFIHKSSV